jgi:hypothetical protein
MLKDVVAVEPLPEHRLRVRFDDGTEGVVDVAQLVAFTGVFEPLRDATFFGQVKVHPELGTVSWPNDADLDSEVLYSKISGKPIPEYVPAKR